MSSCGDFGAECGVLRRQAAVSNRGALSGKEAWIGVRLAEAHQGRQHVSYLVDIYAGLPKGLWGERLIRDQPIDGGVLGARVAEPEAMPGQHLRRHQMPKV